MAVTIPAITLIGKKTSRLAGITSAVPRNNHGAGQSLSRYRIT